jgi:predicted DNA binding CopG/RHH family protein
MKKSNGKKRNKEQELLAESADWESGKRGSHSVAASERDETAVDETMELQMISIRLPQSVVENLKSMAKKEGIGYQPYTRQVLIHHTQGDSGTGKLHDLEERLRSVEKAVFKKTAGR